MSKIRRFAPVLGLLLLAPWVGEFLLGTSPIQNLAAALVLLLPMYGGGALLIREVARRLGRGWPTMLFFGAAYGIIQACLIDQSLFNTTYFDTQLNRIAAPIPLVGISAYDFLSFVGGHAIWSICVPIAIVEMLTPSRRETPWLGNKGLFSISILVLVGCAIIFSFTYMEERFIASLFQLTGGAIGAFVFISIGFILKKNNRTTNESVSLIKPIHLGIASFAASSLFFSRPESWGGVIWGVCILLLSWILISRWSRHRDWSIQHHFAIIAGTLLTYVWGGFTMTLLLWPDNTWAWIGNVIFALMAIALLAVTAKRIHNPVG